MRWLMGALLVAPLSAAPPVSTAKAREIYHARCEKCHGPDGHAPQTGEGLSFADGEWKHGSDRKSVLKVIANGVPYTGMNAFKGKLSAEEIQALAKYVRSLDKHPKK
jgi:mono/diheme cytochrome c family protein